VRDETVNYATLTAFSSKDLRKYLLFKGNVCRCFLTFSKTHFFNPNNKLCFLVAIPHWIVEIPWLPLPEISLNFLVWCEGMCEMGRQRGAKRRRFDVVYRAAFCMCIRLNKLAKQNKQTVSLHPIGASSDTHPIFVCLRMLGPQKSTLAQDIYKHSRG